MKKSITFTYIFVSLLFLTNAYSQSSKPLFYGKNSSEAYISFEGFVDLIGQPQNTSEDMIKLTVEKQLTFLFGTLSNQPLMGSPKGQHQYTVLRIEKTKSSSEIKKIRAFYQYKGLAQLDNEIKDTHTLLLPIDPFTVYQKALTSSKNRYDCLDAHYPYEIYFWYFWNPTAYGCGLKLNVDYTTITAQVKRLKNTVQTFPEYDRLLNDNNELQIDILMGLNEDSLSTNPYKSNDIAASNYIDIQKRLLESGFESRIWNFDEIRARSPKAIYSEQAFVESFQKKTNKGLISVRFFFGPTTLNNGSVFQDFYKDALKNSSVVIYAGHSGLGEYLDLNNIEKHRGYKFEFNPNKYQIYFFNGCTSYPYYNSQFFKRKNGTKNLDIITNGLATLFLAIPDSTWSLISAMDNWMSNNNKLSYQEIIDNADSNNLIGVNGDEDND
jgi:hypothetical protein